MIARTCSIALIALASGLAHAGGVSYQTVPVLEVEPRHTVTRTPIERTVCWDETTYQRVGGSSNSATPTIVGAIIGGVVGNQFGGGSGNTAMTAAGAALGGSIGRDAARANRPSHYTPVTQERCTIQRDFEERSVVTGYRVLYMFDGRIHETTMRHHPGDSIRLRVSATPVP